MSATRDTSQKIAFLYTNLYQVYRKEKSGLSQILKTGEVRVGTPIPSQTLSQTSIHQPTEKKNEAISIKEFRPQELRPSKTHEKDATLKAFAVKPNYLKQATQAQDPAFERLGKSLTELQEIQSRLRFMLTELEQILKRST
jgi:hypothetical protein